MGGMERMVSTDHMEVEHMDRMKVVGTEVDSQSRYQQVEHMEVEGMDTDVEGTNHMAPEVEGMDHMAPEVGRRRGIVLGDAAKNRHRSDDVSENNHLRDGLVARRKVKAAWNGWNPGSAPTGCGRVEGVGGM